MVGWLVTFFFQKKSHDSMKENKLIQKKFDHITLLNTVQQKDMNMNPT